MKKITLLLIALSTVPMFANSANYEGVWISGDLGQAKVNGNEYIFNEGTSLDVNVGYDFNENIAIYSGLGTFKNLNNKDINHLNLGFKFGMPVSEKWSLNANMGAVSVTNSELSGKARMAIGLGLSYQITPKISTQVNYGNYRNVEIAPQTFGFENDKNINVISWGLTYSFNRPEARKHIIQQIKIHEEN